MASAALAEIDAGLQGLLSLKAPGVSGSRIGNLTALCVANVESESVIVGKLYLHYKKTPGTHKLGVLYVVDSVTRKWLDAMKAEGQTIGVPAQDGTPAAGVQRVTELMPTMMNDIISTAPEDQKEKIEKLVAIWEKGQTFPPSMIESFKAKLAAPRQMLAEVSTTPPGSPPPNLLASLGIGSRAAPTAPPPRVEVPNVLEQLANIARLNATTTQSNPSLAAPVPTAAPASAFVYHGTTSSQSNGSGPPAPLNMAAPSGIPYFPPTSQPAPPVNYASQAPAYPSLGLTAPPVQAPVLPVAAAGAVSSASNPTVVPAANHATVQLLATLMAQGVPLDKLADVVKALGQNTAAAPTAPAPQVSQLAQMPLPTQTGYAGPPPATAPVAAPPGPAPWEMPRVHDTRDRNGYHDPQRSPGRQRGRSRSRSPRGWDARDSPRTARGNDRDRGYDYGRPNSPGRSRPDDQERRGGYMPDYRQRSPPARRGPSPSDREPVQSEKWIEMDYNLPPGCIKVYSRTLFVGGVTCSESDLRRIFERYGKVQTCIVNKDKRHAFVKMYYRKAAEVARNAMEENRTPDVQLRTRWGVGFGPRDCSDYQSGISIIPIHKLTEADRKWMLTAPFGGSGGREIVPGLCVEEPDIEIGAGVSSKAISRRMQTDKGGNHGPKSTRRDDDHGHHGAAPEPPRGGGGGRWRRGKEGRHNGASDRRDDRSDRGANDEPVVLGLPAGITMGPNGINYPPNFAFGNS